MARRVFTRVVNERFDGVADTTVIQSYGAQCSPTLTTCALETRGMGARGTSVAIHWA